MSDYTTSEIEAAVDYDWHGLGYGDGPETLELRGEQVPVKRVGGKEPCEGGGEDIDVVIQVDDQFFQKTGYYASHQGSEWDGPLTLVRPEEKTITVYVAV